MTPPTISGALHAWNRSIARLRSAGEVISAPHLAHCRLVMVKDTRWHGIEPLLQ